MNGAVQKIHYHIIIIMTFINIMTTNSIRIIIIFFSFKSAQQQPAQKSQARAAPKRQGTLMNPRLRIQSWSGAATAASTLLGGVQE